MTMTNSCPYDQLCDECNLRQTWLTRYQVHYAVLNQGSINLKMINLVSPKSLTKERATQLIVNQLKPKSDLEILVLNVMTGHALTKCGIDNQFTPSLNCYYPQLDCAS